MGVYHPGACRHWRFCSPCGDQVPASAGHGGAGEKIGQHGIFTLQRIKNRQVIWNFRLLYGNIWEYVGIYIYIYIIYIYIYIFIRYIHMEFPPIITIYVESWHPNPGDFFMFFFGKLDDGTPGGYIHPLQGDWCWCLPPRWHCNAL